ncbi:axonemal central apparatus assembly, partial [Trichomonas vaginalis G3]
MSVRIEPGKAFFPPAYISSQSQIIISFSNQENTRKTLVFRSDPKKIADSNKELVDIYDIKQRETICPASRYDRSTFHFDREKIDLWPNGSQQVLLYFTPQIAKQYDETIYICTEDNSFVYPFRITGQGLPPVATFLTDCIQVGHVGLDSVLDYRVELANAGQVDIDFELEPKDTNDLVFQFNPSKGHLRQGEKLPVEVRFIASNVGAFNETFVYKVKGATKSHPTITFTGKVIGPSFQITPRVVNFGNVGLGFLCSQKVTLENKSEIPFDYTFDIKTDGSHELREFLIKPSRGHIDKFSSIDITIELIPNSVRNYNLSLQFGIDRFQKTILSIPVIANCVCPELTLSTTNLDFGNVFIGCPYTKEISLQNNSEFAARYEFNSFGEQRVGELTVEKVGGIVEPHSSCNLQVMLTGKIIGNVKLECYFKIIGSEKPPLHLSVSAICTGPTIQYSLSTVNFGNINILKKETKSITISNNSLIPAKFKAVIDQITPTFASDITEGEIAPNSTFTYTVSATVNDTLTFQGKLKFMFDYLTVTQMPLIATGIGTPIISSIDMSEINLGYILTQQPTKLNFTLKNVSRRNYEVRVSHTKPHVPKDSQAVVQLAVEPDFVQLSPDEECYFEITTMCMTTVAFTVQIQVNATVQRSRVEVYNTLMKATFIDPIVTFSSQMLEFKQNTLQPQITYEEISPTMDMMAVMTKPLTITNNNQIPLQCEVDCPQPFSMPSTSFTLEPSQTYSTQIVFDPSFKNDFNSEVIQKKLSFSFDDHPQKQIVQLKAIVNFPNISFDHEGPIDFGTMVSNTEQTKTVNLTCVFDKDIEYKWEILGSIDDETKVFDVFPIRGTIEAQKSIQTHFSFFAQGAADGSTKKYKAIAVCHVKSGPDYTFELSGSSATINYKIEPKSIDFGKIDFMSTVSNEVVIDNTSNVPISFNIKIPKRSKFSSFTITPISGKVEPKSTQELKVTITPGTPIKYNESFTIQIGKFEDTQVLVNLDAQFAQVELDIPRSFRD